MCRNDCFCDRKPDSVSACFRVMRGIFSIKAVKYTGQDNGNINIKSYDDSIHANNDSALENSQTPLKRFLSRTIFCASVRIYPQ